MEMVHLLPYYPALYTLHPHLSGPWHPSLGSCGGIPLFVSPLLAAIMGRLYLLSWVGGYQGLDLSKKWMET